MTASVGVTPTTTAALADTGARLGAAAEHLGFGVGTPHGDGWARLDTVIGPGLLDRMADALLAEQGRRDVAGSYLGSHLVGPLLGATVGAMALDQRCPDPDPAGLAVHLHPEGWFDRLSFLHPRVAVLAQDPAAGQPDTVVLADPVSLRAWWAERTVAAVEPLLDAVGQRLGSARRGLWGSVADRVAGVWLAAARAANRPGEVAWAEAMGLLDALAEHAPVRLSRPSPFPVAASAAGQAWFPVRGTCCLYYLTVEAPDPCGDGYCTTCPFTDPGHRERKLATWLQEQQGRR